MKFETKYLIRWGIPGWVFATWLFIVLCITVDDFTKLLTDPQNLSKILGILITLLSLGVPIGYIFQQIYFAWEWKNDSKNTKLKPITSKIKNKVKDYTFQTDPIENQTVGENADGADAGATSGNGATSGEPVTVDSTEPVKRKMLNKNFREDYYYIECLWHKLLISAEKEKRDYIIGRYRYFLSTIHGLGSLLYSLSSSAGLIVFFLFAIADGAEGKWAMGVLLVIHALLIFGTHKNYRYYSKNLINFQAFFLNEMLEDEEKKKQTENEATPQEPCKHKIVLEIKAPE